MPRKSQLTDDDDDLDLFDDDNVASSETLDAIFDQYHTPDVQDGDPDADEAFLPAITRDTEAMLTDLEEADRLQKLKEQEKSRHIVSRVKNIVLSGVDYNYFFSVVFVSEAQKNEFIEKSGWGLYGGTRFLNGVELAQAMGIDLTPDYVAPEVKPDRRLAQRSQKGR